jgi:hypothetical protein
VLSYKLTRMFCLYTGVALYDGVVRLLLMLQWHLSKLVNNQIADLFGYCDELRDSVVRTVATYVLINFLVRPEQALLLPLVPPSACSSRADFATSRSS